ncbi:unnamed protein product, partial [Mesorhabditis belari]|uniref:Protein kinase domain-containing protein n=1 Tax=Mesorhabditis belari TaxID=2138241 RepID=A0AAF3EUX5_9BILA
MLSKCLLYVFAIGLQAAAPPYGQLSVVGKNLVGANGQKVALHGMSLFWSQWTEGSTFYNNDTIQALKCSWNANVVRAAMGVEAKQGGYLNNPTTRKAELAKLYAVVDAAIDAGIYVIIDWHDHNAQNQASAAVSFFSAVSQKYASYPNVIYETFNEPLQDVDVAAGNPLSGSNLMYTLHYYAATHKQYLRDKAQTALNQGLPIFVTEHGTVEHTGDGQVDQQSSNDWYTFLEDNKISYVNWAISNKAEGSAALKPGTTTQQVGDDSRLTTSGRFVKNRMRDQENGIACSGVSNPRQTSPPQTNRPNTTPRRKNGSSGLLVSVVSVNSWGNGAQYKLVFQNTGSHAICGATFQLNLNGLNRDNHWNFDRNGSAWVLPPWACRRHVSHIGLELGNNTAMGQALNTCEDGEDNFRSQIAMKCFVINGIDPLMSKQNLAAVTQELKTLKMLIHKNIVEFKGDFEHQENHNHYRVIVLEYLPNGSLDEVIFNPNYSFTDHTVIEWSIDTFEGLTFMHSKNIRHGDVKPANLFLTIDFRIKLGDFDLTRIEEESGCTERQQGTERYRAPELWKKRFNSRRNDVWSTGVVMWEMFARKHCFKKESGQGRLEELSRKWELKPPKLETDHPFAGIVRKCLIQNVTRRPVASEIHEDLLSIQVAYVSDYSKREFKPFAKQEPTSMKHLDFDAMLEPEIPKGFEKSSVSEDLPTTSINSSLSSSHNHISLTPFVTLSTHSNSSSMMSTSENMTQKLSDVEQLLTRKGVASQIPDIVVSTSSSSNHSSISLPHSVTLSTSTASTDNDIIERLEDGELGVKVESQVLKQNNVLAADQLTQKLMDLSITISNVVDTIEQIQCPRTASASGKAQLSSLPAQSNPSSDFWETILQQLIQLIFMINKKASKS